MTLDSFHSLGIDICIVLKQSSGDPQILGLVVGADVKRGAAILLQFGAWLGAGL